VPRQQWWIHDAEYRRPQRKWGQDFSCPHRNGRPNYQYLKRAPTK
jgi:hypothetical protein